MSDYAVVTVRGNLQGRAVSSRFSYVRVSGSLVFNSMKRLGSAWQTALQTLWLAMLSEEYFLQQLDIRDPEAEQSDPGYVVIPNTAGSVAQQSLPSSSAGIIRQSVDGTSSRKNGRIYYCGIPETLVTNQALNNGYLTGNVQPFADALLTNLMPSDGTEWQLVVLAYPPVGTVHPIPTHSNVVQTTALSHLITQRQRRTRYLGTDG